MSSPGLPSKTKEQLIAEVDVTSRARIACLAARTLSDFQIGELLFLSTQHIEAVRETEEFRKKYAEEADRIIQEQIDRDEGWDGLESLFLEKLLQTARYNSDPKFLLLGAQIANRAERRTKTKKAEPTVLDATAQPQGAKIFVLNKNYIDNRSSGAIDVTPRPKQIPLKQSDTPAPKMVDQLLAPVLQDAGKKADPQEEELERLFREAGVVFDGNSDGN